MPITDDLLLPPPPKSHTLLLMIILILVIAGSTYYYLYVTYPELFKNISSKITSVVTQISPTSPTPIPTLLASPKPTSSPKPIPHGPIKLNFSQEDKTIPQFSQGLLNPYDPAKGDSQTFTVNLKHSKSIISVTAKLATDNAFSPAFPLKLIRGNDLDGTWEGTWTITDSYLYRYVLLLKANSSDKSSSIDIILR